MLSTDKQTNRQTDRQTNQRYQKHNLLCQGGNEYTVNYHSHSLWYFHGPELDLMYGISVIPNTKMYARVYYLKRNSGQ